MKRCSVVGCHDRCWAKGLCQRHYRQQPERQKYMMAYRRKYKADRRDGYEESMVKI